MCPVKWLRECEGGADSRVQEQLQRRHDRRILSLFEVREITGGEQWKKSEDVW